MGRKKKASKPPAPPKPPAPVEEIDAASQLDYFRKLMFSRQGRKSTILASGDYENKRKTILG
jgi:hypothetical protein